MEEIFDHLRQHAPEQAWNWYMFALGTGVRPSEQIALQWDDVDWNHRTIRVRRARVRGEVKGTKTAVERDVDLSDGMIAVLARQKRSSEGNGSDTPIFLNPVSGLPWPDVQDQRKLSFHPALEALREADPAPIRDGRADGRSQSRLYLATTGGMSILGRCSAVAPGGSMGRIIAARR